jgi:rhodanese-related sulfurtransferase
MRSNRQSIILIWACVALGALPAAAQDPAPSRDAAVVDRIGIDDFRKLHARGAALVVDVRGAEAFKAGHISGAVNVPLDQVERRAGEIRAKAKGRAIVTYCSCPDEHASLAAVRVLAGKNVANAMALVGGYPAWVSGKGER